MINGLTLLLMLSAFIGGGVLGICVYDQMLDWEEEKKQKLFDAHHPSIEAQMLADGWTL